MFSNIGKKIQGLCTVVFTIEALIFCVVGLYFGVGLSNSTNEPLYMLIGIVVAGVGIFISWLGLLLLYAFGKIAESCEEQVELTRQLLALQSTGRPAEPAAEPEERICRSCGSKVDSDALFCAECGAPCKG